MASILVQKKTDTQEILALIENDIVKQIFVSRTAMLNLDEITEGNITDYNTTLRGYFIKTQKGIDIFTPAPKSYAQGEKVTVLVTKEARLGKDATGRIIATTPAEETSLPFCEKISAQFQAPVLPQEKTDYNLFDIIDEALAKKIVFTTGAELFIERTQAFWSIDVDSAKSTLSFEKLNELATKEIYHQIILKNLSGIILIDFAGFKTGKERAKLVRLMRALFQSDTRTKVYDFTNLGLLEIRRNRTSACLNDLFQTPDGARHPLYTILMIEDALMKTKSVLPTLFINPKLQPYITDKIQKLAKIQLQTETQEDFFEITEG